MCGIVGYSGGQDACGRLMHALSCLEYRGYDSAGVALWEDGEIQVLKEQGRLDRLRALAEEHPHPGGCGGGGLQVRERGDADGDVLLHGTAQILPDKPYPGGDRGGDARASQGEGLAEGRDAQCGRSGVHRGAGHIGHTVVVGVGLDHGHDSRRGDQPGEGAHIVRHRIQIDDRFREDMRGVRGSIPSLRTVTATRP